MNLAYLTDSKAIRDTFLKKYCVQRKFGSCTVKTYLQSIKNLYSFCQSELNSMFSNELMAEVKVEIKNWMRTYQRQPSQHKHLTDYSEGETQLTCNTTYKLNNVRYVKW